MSARKGWSRRNFVQLMGTAALASHASALPRLASDFILPPLNDGTILFAGCRGSSSGKIEVFSVREGQLALIQRVPAECPSSMVVSRDRRVLYVVNQIEQFQGLPRGTVEAYSIDHDGHIGLLNRQPLSLAATMPKHAAIAPDGSGLLVTAHGGGILNHLPILEDGSLGRVDGISKLTGGADGSVAQPLMTVFDSRQGIVSLDAGTGSLRLLRIEDGGLKLHSHSSIKPQALPQHVAVNHDADTIYVASRSGIDSYVYDSSTGKILNPLQNIRQSITSLTMHPSGRLLFSGRASGGLSVWSIDRGGKLSSCGQVYGGTDAVDLIEASPDGHHLLAASTATGTISAVRISPDGGAVDGLKTLAQLDSPRSLAAIYA